MSDYRGGKANINPYTAQAIEAIRRGDTERQRKRDFNQNLYKTIGTSALTIGGGIISGLHSKSLQDEQAQAAADQKLAAPSEFTRARGGDAEPEKAPPPAWLTAAQEEPHDLKAMADTAIANQAANGAASAAPVATWYTPEGIDATHESATAQNNDMNTGKNIMKMGGMMNSAPRVPR